MSKLYFAPVLRWLCLLGLWLGAGLLATTRAQDRPLALKRVEGFELSGELSIPPSGRPDFGWVFLPGSGPQNMDSDFSSLTKDKQPFPFFLWLKDELVDRNQAVFRFHKRSYQFGLLAKEDPNFLKSKPAQVFLEDPLGSFLEDAKAALGLLRSQLPEGTPVGFLGHSQGAHLALWAHEAKPDGLALIGFSLVGSEAMIYQQTVERPLELVRALDLDQSGALEPEELSASAPLARQLKAQMPLLDRNQDGSLQYHEFRAGNLSNWLVTPFLKPLQPLIRTGAKLPSIPDLVQALKVPTVFLQGTFDNQTPVHHAQAVEMSNVAVWKRDSFHFEYFPERGHALDPRRSWGDLEMQPMRAADRLRVGRVLVKVFGRAGSSRD